MTKNKLKVFSEWAKDCLQSHFSDNLAQYNDAHSGYEWVRDFFDAQGENKTYEYELDIEIPGSEVEHFGVKSNGEMMNWVEFSMQLYNHYGNLDPDILLQPVFWSYLTHRHCQRWISHWIKNESSSKELKVYNYIPESFPRGYHKCQVARCYMTAKWAHEFRAEFSQFEIENVLNAFNSDVFLHVADRRPSANKNLRNALLYCVVNAEEKLSRNEFRHLTKYLDRLCGAAAVEILSTQDLIDRFNAELERYRKTCTES